MTCNGCVICLLVASRNYRFKALTLLVEKARLLIRYFVRSLCYHTSLIYITLLTNAIYNSPCEFLLAGKKV